MASDRRVYDHEAEGHMPSIEEMAREMQAEHDQCEHPPFPGNNPSQLAAFSLWMHRHGVKVHGQPGFKEHERAFVHEFRSVFDLDLDDDVTRETIIKFAIGGLLMAGNVAGDDPPAHMHVFFMNLMQGTALEAAEWQMGENADG